VTAEVTCEVCGVTVPRVQPHQRRCGAAKCRKRGQYLAARNKPGFVDANRARSREWYERHKEEHIARVAARRCKAGASGRWFITPHAVEQYRQRALRRADEYETALLELIDESKGAHFVKRLASGLELWRGPPPRRMRYLVGPGEGDLPALVTVLFAFDRVVGEQA
jgi:hypothetical protein